MKNSKIKNVIFGTVLAIAIVACEGKSDPMVDNYGIDQGEMDKTRAKIDSMPAAIRKDYLKSDSLIHQDMKKEIAALKAEIATLKEEIKNKKRQ